MSEQATAASAIVDESLDAGPRRIAPVTLQAKMLRLELLNLKADLERDLAGTRVLGLRPDGPLGGWAGDRGRALGASGTCAASGASHLGAGARPLVSFTAMDLFLDTNVYLAFYSLSNDDLEELRKLNVAVNSQETTLYITTQVVDEFNRNRESVIADSLRILERATLQRSFPRLFMNYPGYETLRAALDTYDEERARLLDDTRRDAVERKLHADELIGELFKLGKSIPITPEIFERAQRRFDLGNPPGKNESYGDAVNWVALLQEVPEARDLLFVTGDSDFMSKLDPARLSEFLRNEWVAEKKSSVILYSTLSGLFRERYPHIKLAADLEKELAINRLIASENFLQTHSRLMKVAQFADFTPEQAEALIRAANRNTQIRWVLGDDDVSDFYVELAGNYGDMVDPEEMAMFWANLSNATE